MPLNFIYREDKLKKSDLSLLLLDFKDKLHNWTDSYSVDCEITVKKFKDLEKIQKHFPDKSPIIFIEGNYPKYNFTNEELFKLFSSYENIRLFASFKGKECPSFGVRIFIWNPHFRGFTYFKPNIDEEISSIIIDPLVSINTRDDSKPVPELVKMLYSRISEKIKMPSLDEWKKLPSYKSPDTGIEVQRSGLVGLTLKAPQTYKPFLHDVFKWCLEVSERPTKVRVQIINTLGNIKDFLSSQVSNKGFEIEQCGVDTVAIGELGSIKKLNINTLNTLLDEIPKSSDLEIKFSNLKWKIPLKEDYGSQINITAKRRSLVYFISIPLDIDDIESEEFKEIINKIKILTDLPVDKPRYWIVEGYHGKHYEKVISNIQQFKLSAIEVSQKIISKYKLSDKHKNLKICDYYEPKPGIFTKSKLKVSFKDTLIKVLKEILSDFKYDAKGSLPQYGAFTFLRKDKGGLYNYAIFERDISWGAKIFRINFRISKYKITDPSMIIGYWWSFDRDSTDFIGNNLWWHYKNEKDLEDTINNAVEFIKDVGDIFFNQIGKLLKKYFNEFDLPS